mmetsp:Transcript_12588/g.47059  ORF Transcript_12588/g.47059 Transcript_12588/m.47059 type:complete len:414 (-) Transcript_12588:339-1580(-)
MSSPISRASHNPHNARILRVGVMEMYASAALLRTTRRVFWYTTGSEFSVSSVSFAEVTRALLWCSSAATVSTTVATTTSSSTTVSNAETSKGACVSHLPKIARFRSPDTRASHSGHRLLHPPTGGLSPACVVGSTPKRSERCVRARTIAFRFEILVLFVFSSPCSVSKLSAPLGSASASSSSSAVGGRAAQCVWRNPRAFTARFVPAASSSWNMTRNENTSASSGRHRSSISTAFSFAVVAVGSGFRNGKKRAPASVSGFEVEPVCAVVAVPCCAVVVNRCPTLDNVVGSKPAAPGPRSRKISKSSSSAAVAASPSAKEAAVGSRRNRSPFHLFDFDSRLFPSDSVSFFPSPLCLRFGCLVFVFVVTSLGFCSEPFGRPAPARAPPRAMGALFVTISISVTTSSHPLGLQALP